MGWIRDTVRKVAGPIAGIVDPVTSLAGGYGRTSQRVAAVNISTGAKGALALQQFGNFIPGVSSQMPGFSFSGGEPSGNSGGNWLETGLDVILAERRRKDEAKAIERAEQNKLADRTAAYNRDITLAQIQAQGQFFSQLAAAGVPSAAFPGGWLPGSNTLNVPPGNYGSFPATDSRVTQRDKPKNLSFAPWMIYAGIAAIALMFLPFLVKGK